MKRPLVALMALAAALSGRGQSCFRVVHGPENAGLPACTVRCLDGTGPWFTDTHGLVCLNVACDSALVERAGFERALVRVEMAAAIGMVRLNPGITDLKAVEVEPWPRAEDRHALAAATTLDSAALAGFERSSLRSASLWTPGVQWDERGHGGSTRLSIRGSLLRSPYGVRGVKVYWGPFPLTLADGSTPLELLDPLLVGSLDIVRSVGSPVYGTAPSGMLLASAPLPDRGVADASLEATGGSNGYYRIAALARNHLGAHSLAAGVVRQRNDGYRAQEWSARDQAFIASNVDGRNGSTRMFLTWQNASWALPGSIDAPTAREAPRAARPYSVLLDAHVEKQQVMGGIASEVRLGRNGHLRSGVHAQLIDKVNPYGTAPQNCGFKEETIRAVGARLAMGSDRLLARLPISWEVGMEALFERDHLRELTYLDGVRGDIKVNGDTRVRNLNAFINTISRLGPRTTLHAGLGTERTDHHHTDEVTAIVNDRSTTPKALPYAGVEHRWTDRVRAHARYAESISRVTVWELLGGSGVYNKELRGEVVREVEGGLNIGSESTPTSMALVGYYRSTRGLIAETTGVDLIPVFMNVGNATISGLEWMGELRGRIDADWGYTALLSATWQHPLLEQPGVPEAAIPGIEPYRAGTMISATYRGNNRMELGYRTSGSVPASTMSGSGIPGYGVLHLRMGHRFRWSGASMDLFLHCENLLDARYVSWVQVNDPGGRYYNPAPGRSFFGGARLTFGSRHRSAAD